MRSWLILLCLAPGLWLGATAFALREPRAGLPDLLGLPVPKGQRWFRVQTHLHGPFSYDACDDKGLNPDGSINPQCERDLKDAICANHLDFAFLTDHPHKLEQATYPAVLLKGPKDSAVRTAKGREIAIRIGCENGFRPYLMPGLEGTLLGLGMEWRDDSSWRKVMESGGSAKNDAKLLFEKETGAVVGVPHTESRSLEYLYELKPDFIEVFNLHASGHPLIRRDHLGESWFMGGLLKYLFDPVGWANPDFFVLEFLKLSPVYFEKWAKLLSRFGHVTGVLGIDSHQNVFRMKAEDGLRLDSHRRMLGQLSNWILAPDLTPDSAKSAIREGRVLGVFEVLGTPAGFDFFALSRGRKPGTAVRTGMGGGASLKSSPVLEIRIPSVHSPLAPIGSEDRPKIFADLIHVNPEGVETRILTGQTADFSHVPAAPGHYRVEIFIIPLHLKRESRSERLSRKTYPWVISNPIRVL